MKVTILAGDGIGPEIINEAVKVLAATAKIYDIPLETQEQLVGGVAIRATGSPFPDATREACIASDAVLLGAVGSPEFDNLPPARRPEKGLLEMRQALGGFANLRPAFAYKSLIDSSPLRREVFEGTDMLIVRELLGGIYFGEPRGFSEGNDEGYNTMRYSRAEVERVARVAFEAARKRGKKLTSVDKANVLEASRLWRQTVDEISHDYPDITVEHLFVDACAMHLVTNPSRFDVIVTENMFGDILSDEAAVLTGSLGMLASATIGGKVGLYEPIHGSAPDIAGQNIANPLGTIASVAMLFRYTAKNEEAAALIETAIEKVLEDGYRTADIARDDHQKSVSTQEMGRLVLENITSRSSKQTA